MINRTHDFEVSLNLGTLLVEDDMQTNGPEFKFLAASRYVFCWTFDGCRSGNKETDLLLIKYMSFSPVSSKPQTAKVLSNLRSMSLSNKAWI